MPEAARTVPWECTDLRELLLRLIGFEFGEQPQEHIPQIRQWRERLVQQFDECFLRLRPTDTLLEIGPGCGFTTRAFASRVARVHAADISQAFLRYARHECADLANVSFQQTSFTDLSYLPDESVDAVVASAVLIHADLFGINALFTELKRVVRPGGRVAFDILDANRLPASNPLFTAHAKLYRDNPGAYPELCKWNSGTAVLELARHHGFVASLFPEPGDPCNFVLAEKGAISEIEQRLATEIRLRDFQQRHPPGYLQPGAD